MSYDAFDSRQMPGISYVRLFHAAPGAPAVDIYANNRLLARRLSYEQFSDYIQLDSGTYNIKVYPAGTQVTPVLSISLPLTEQTIYTLAVIGLPPRIGILPIEDGYEEFNVNSLNTRFINLSPDSPSLDLVTREGTVVFSDVAFTEVSDYIPTRPGLYNFFVRPAGQSTNLLYFPARLLPRRNLSFYVIGSFGARNMKVLIPMDGSTYLRY